METEKFLNVSEVCQRLGVSQATLWRMRRDGDFPPPTQLSVRRKGWKLSVIVNWEDARTGKAADDG